MCTHVTSSFFFIFFTATTSLAHAGESNSKPTTLFVAARAASREEAGSNLYPKASIDSGCKLVAPDLKAKTALVEYIRCAATSANSLGEKIADEKVVFVGEFHPDLRAREFIRSHLAELKGLGFSVLALEMFNSVDQQLLDSYARGEAARSGIFQNLKENWGWFPESYQLLIDTAIEAGFRILALDDNSLASVNLRDIHMARILSEHFAAHPNSRIVAYMGGEHASYVGPQSQRKILEASGISTLGFSIDFKDDLNRNNDPDWFPNESVEALVGGAFDETKIGSSIFVPFPKEQYSFDWFIFQP